MAESKTKFFIVRRNENRVAVNMTVAEFTDRDEAVSALADFREAVERARRLAPEGERGWYDGVKYTLIKQVTTWEEETNE